ncbi:Uncharacterised protein [uncultured Clostridium sp.]|nr:Uncharacterised protein [uncultured Clostridium sp.]
MKIDGLCRPRITFVNSTKQKIFCTKFPAFTKVGAVRGQSGGEGAQKQQGRNRLRPGLRMGYAEEGETSQDPGHCLSRTLASLPRVLLIRGFVLFGVTRS